jgi:hypothetical protein
MIVLLVPLFTACASSGLYNMSDTWCAAHPGASLARCPTKKNEERRVAANDEEHAADGNAATDH